jgi:hypothetical protein
MAPGKAKMVSNYMPYRALKWMNDFVTNHPGAGLLVRV